MGNTFPKCTRCPTKIAECRSLELLRRCHTDQGNAHFPMVLLDSDAEDGACDVEGNGVEWLPCETQRLTVGPSSTPIEEKISN